MSGAATVESRERLRLFCALRLPDNVLDELVSWQRRAFAGVGGVRILAREQLHVTLAFLGGRPVAEVGPIAEALRTAAAAAHPIVLAPRRYRETRSVGMVVLDDADGHAAALAVELFGRLEELGVYERERRPWLPHVTVIRFRRPPRLALEPPALGAIRPSDAALYHSVLRPTGAQYEVLEAVALGGR